MSQSSSDVFVPAAPRARPRDLPAIGHPPIILPHTTTRAVDRPTRATPSRTDVSRIFFERRVAASSVAHASTRASFDALIGGGGTD